MPVIRAPFVTQTVSESILTQKQVVCYVVGNEEDILPDSEEEIGELIHKLASPITDGLVSFTFFVAILWLCEGEPVVDLWCFEGRAGNPEVRLVLCTGGYEHNTIASCGDSLIILGLEEMFRRSCDSIWDFANGPRPTLPDYLIGWK